MPQMKKVLILDDDSSQLEYYEKELSGKIKVLSTRRMADARRAFIEHPDVAVIVLDGMVNDPNEGEYSYALASALRKKFPGPIVAASGCQDIREKLMQAGCNYESEKDGVPDLVLKLAGVT